MQGGDPDANGDHGIWVGHSLADDAAVVRFSDADADADADADSDDNADNEERALVLTTDVITPIVDDPATFGAIAACNALSDIYAMGGTPRYVLNLAFFPDDALPLSVLREILRGAAEICALAGAPVVGGHTVRDAEPKFGLAVTGEVSRGRLLANTGARAGQVLVLTKALGTGVIGSAIRARSASPAEIDAAVRSMTTLNASALRCAERYRVRSATDVTGFGLLGHLRNILRGSTLAARLDMSSLPVLPGVLARIRRGEVPGGTRANLRFVDRWLVRVAAGVGQGENADNAENAGRAERAGNTESTGKGENADNAESAGRAERAGRTESTDKAEIEVLTLLAADAQTSGGLLLCVDAEDASALCRELVDVGLPARQVGELLAPEPSLRPETMILDFSALR